MGPVTGATPSALLPPLLLCVASFLVSPPLVAGIVGEAEARACVRSLPPSELDHPAPPEGCIEEIPKELVQGYLMGGKVRLRQKSKCDRLAKRREGYHPNLIKRYREMVRRRASAYHPQIDPSLYKLLDQLPRLLTGMQVVVMGSKDPMYEALSLEYGAANVTTIEQHKMSSPHPKVRVLQPDEFLKRPHQFDVAISITSFENAGLGRDGGGLRVDRDLELMSLMKCLVRPGGSLLLSVPVGKDKVVWNSHRVYGWHRLPLLLQDWRLLGVFGELSMDQRKFHQPLLHLVNEPPSGEMKNHHEHNMWVLKASANLEGWAVLRFLQSTFSMRVALFLGIPLAVLALADLIWNRGAPVSPLIGS